MHASPWAGHARAIRAQSVESPKEGDNPSLPTALRLRRQGGGGQGPCRGPPLHRRRPTHRPSATGSPAVRGLAGHHRAGDQCRPLHARSLFFGISWAGDGIDIDVSDPSPEPPRTRTPELAGRRRVRLAAGPQPGLPGGRPARPRRRQDHPRPPGRFHHEVVSTCWPARPHCTIATTSPARKILSSRSSEVAAWSLQRPVSLPPNRPGSPSHSRSPPLVARARAERDRYRASAPGSDAHSVLSERAVTHRSYRGSHGRYRALGRQ